MPIGSYAPVPRLCNHLVAVQPKTVLDVGIGFGFNGALIRQQLDLGVEPYRVRLEGIEAWSGYRSACWTLYHHVYEMHTDGFDWGHHKYDFIICTDVIEHFEKDAGRLLLQRMRASLTPGGRVFVSTPAVWMEQGAVYGNPHERHMSLWNANDFTRAGYHEEWGGLPDPVCGHQMLQAVGYAVP